MDGLETALFGTAVLWLGPEDPAPFSNLTSAVFAEFPPFPPFGGQFDEVIPHLTVGIDGPADTVRSAEEQIVPSLPVLGRAAAITLIGESSPNGRWGTLASFRWAERCEACGGSVRRRAVMCLDARHDRGSPRTRVYGSGDVRRRCLPCCLFKRP